MHLKDIPFMFQYNIKIILQVFGIFYLADFLNFTIVKLNFEKIGSKPFLQNQ